MLAYLALKQKTKRRKQFFSYKIPPQFLPAIQPGQIAAVNFLNKDTLGVIVKFNRPKSKPNYKIKKIKKILPLAPLADWQFKLADYVSQRYGVSFGQAIWSILPQFARRKQIKISSSQKIPAIKLRSQFNIRYLIGSKAERWRKISRLTVNLTAIIVFPEIEQAKLFIHDFCPQAVLFHKGLTKTRQTEIYLQAQRGSIQLIAGTFSSLFLPLKNCRALIIEDFLSAVYQKDNQPKYDVVEVAEKIAKLRKINLVLSDASKQLFNQSSSDDQLFNPQTEIKYLLGPKPLYTLKEQLDPRQTNLIFFPFGDDFRALICRRCGQFILCPNCKKVVSVELEKKQLWCSACQRIFPLPSACPKCGSAELKFLYPGIRQIYSQLKPHLPDLILVERRGALLKRKNISQIIGTNQLFSLPLPQFKCAHFVLPSFIFNSADFAQYEYLYYQLKEIAVLKPAKIYFYLSRKKDLNQLRLLLSPRFRLVERAIRRKHYFPPFSELIKLVCPLDKDKTRRVGYNISKQLPKTEIMGIFPSKMKSKTLLIAKIPARASLAYDWIYPCALSRNLKKIPNLD